MKFETKFNYGDKVWFIKESKAIESEVYSIDVRIQENIEITYWFKVYYSLDDYKFETIKENQIFTTKQELIDSL